MNPEADLADLWLVTRGEPVEKAGKGADNATQGAQAGPGGKGPRGKKGKKGKKGRTTGGADPMVGARVEVHGLVSSPELNGVFGTVIKYVAARERYEVSQ